VRISVGALLACAGAWASLAVAACGGSSPATGTRTSATRTSATTTSRGSGTATSVTTPATTTPTAPTTTATSSTSAGATTGATGPPPCRGAGLALSFLGQQGATGHGELGFALRNRGSASCATIGYPGIQFLDRLGRPLPTAAIRTRHDFFGASPLRALVVGAGQTVSFRLGVTHGIGSTVGCTTASGLQVIVPNDTIGVRITIPNGGAAECGTATVSPLRGGTSAYP
jgi:hypothetical protein